MTMPENFYATLQRGFVTRLDCPFLMLPDGSSVSYREIDHLAGHAASALYTAGAKPGDRILVQVEKSVMNVAPLSRSDVRGPSLHTH